MFGFEPVTVSWKGESFTIPADQQMMLIAKVEDALSGDSGMQALSVLFRKEGPPHSRLAAAFGAVLRHGGAKVSDEDVYLSIMDDMANKSLSETTIAIQSQIMAILSIISPPTARKLTEISAPDSTPKKG